MSQSTPLATAQVPGNLRDMLRQMVDCLQTERLALAGMDLDGIMGCAHDKGMLCGQIEGADAAIIDDECRGLLDAARRLNEMNRQIRNLIAANVAARLEAITGSPALYRAAGGVGAAYAYAGTRG